MILNEYLEYQNKYEKKYGNKTIVLMEVGMFFELYGVKNTTEVLGKVPEIADLLNIQMSRKNKNIIENSRSNPLMAGVPNHSIKKYISILMNHNWTVVLIEQRNAGNNLIERSVSNIYSPGTAIECNDQCETNNLISIYLEQVEQINSKNKIYVAGISVIDLSTGKNKIFQINSLMDDNNLCLDELYRFINIHNPREIIIYSKDLDLSKDELVRYLEIDNKVSHLFLNDIDPNIYKLSYQSEFLQKIFPNTGLLSVIEYLDLEKTTYGLISYIFLLRFAYEHNHIVINKINKPEIWNKNKYLSLTHSSIYQLNLVSIDNIDYHNSRFKSLFHVLNKTQTIIGKRLLKERLLNPIINKEELERRYNYIEIFLDKESGDSVELYKQFETYLSNIRDIERLHRKISLGLLPPCEFYTLNISYQSILDIVNILEQSPSLTQLIPNHINGFKEYVDEYRRLFELDEIVKYNFANITNSFFKKGVHKIIDDIQVEIEVIKQQYTDIIKKLSKMIDENNDTCIKLEYNEQCGYYLSLTNKRCQKLKESLSNISSPIKINDTLELNSKEIGFDKRNANVKLIMDISSKMSTQLINLQEKVKKEVHSYYLQCLEQFDVKYSNYLKEIVQFVGEIDVITSNSKNARIYRYSKPILSTQDTPSYIKATSIRHPIIERIEDKLEYIHNDITLGIDNLNGILLYGVNASGKSSLMKSVGLTIIMAQAGMYVPCDKLEYEPYHYLFTRISNNDNLFKGQSTFAVEMSELRSILKRSNSNSLILGDELCSGTEWISGQSIVASGIIFLAQKKTSFIFATHMHQLVDIDEVKQLDNVQSKHLKVEYDYDSGKLIYDRKITDGVGSSTYGLEVCKAMDLDKEFLEIANKIRNNYFEKKSLIDSPKKSHFNNNLYFDNCKICGNEAEDVHHIKYQSTSDNDGYIGYYHKNIRHNLVPLCRKCHNETHQDKCQINGYIKTSNGIELDYKKIELNSALNGKKPKKKKMDEEQINIIKELKKLPNINQQKALDIAQNKYQFNISINIISKIWNDKY